MSKINDVIYRNLLSFLLVIFISISMFRGGGKYGGKTQMGVGGFGLPSLYEDKIFHFFIRLSYASLIPCSFILYIFVLPNTLLQLWSWKECLSFLDIEVQRKYWWTIFQVRILKKQIALMSVSRAEFFEQMSFEYMSPTFQKWTTSAAFRPTR